MVKKKWKRRFEKSRGKKKKLEGKMVVGVTDAMKNLAGVYLPITFLPVDNQVAMVSRSLTLTNDAIGIASKKINSTD